MRNDPQSFQVVDPLLKYDAATGEIRWRVNRQGFRGIKAGDAAGSPHNAGYVSIRICGRAHLAHHIAWLLSFGVWPSLEIDHKNGVRNDNRLENLRIATRAQRQFNMKTRCNSVSGTKGVSLNKSTSGWQARRQGAGRKLVRTFPTMEEARRAVVCFRDSLHGEYARSA